FLQEHGNPNGAIKVYTDLLSVDPAYVPAMHNIGYIFLFDLQKIPDAIAWFDKAIKTDSTFVLAYYHRGYAHEISGKKDLAKQDYELVLQLDPDFGLSRTRLQNLK